jgi:heat shock protein HslJ
VACAARAVAALLLGADGGPGQAADQLRGQALPPAWVVLASAEATAAAQPLTARGNEPGWSLTIGAAEIELVTEYGARRSTFPRPAPEISGDTTRYVIPGESLTVTLVDAPCADSMSGMFYPWTVTVERTEGALSGCGGEPAALLLGPEWAVESIGGTGIIADSRVTIAFHEDGRLGGSASCNRYNAGYELTGEGLTFGHAASTMMACEPLLMEQERRFFDALAGVRRFEVAPDGALVLLADDGPKLVARR